MERKKYYLIVYLPELDPDPEGTFGMCCGCYYDTLEEAETELQRWRSERRSRCPDECYQVVEAHLTEDELFNLAEEEEEEIDWDDDNYDLLNFLDDENDDED